MSDEPHSPLPPFRGGPAGGWQEPPAAPPPDATLAPPPPPPPTTPTAPRGPSSWGSGFGLPVQDQHPLQAPASPGYGYHYGTASPYGTKRRRRFLPALVVVIALLVVGGAVVGVIASQHKTLTPPAHPVAVANAIGLQLDDLTSDFHRVAPGANLTHRHQTAGCKIDDVGTPWAAVASPVYASTSTNAETFSDVALLPSDADAQSAVSMATTTAHASSCVEPSYTKSVKDLVSTFNKNHAPCVATMGSSSIKPLTISTPGSSEQGFRYVASITYSCAAGQSTYTIDLLYRAVGNVTIGGTFTNVGTGPPDSGLEQSTMGVMGSRAQAYVARQ